MTSKRLLNAALDCITQFLTGHYPLKNVAKTIIASRKLNSGERKIFLDVVFRWARETHVVNQFIGEKIPFSQGMSLQEKNAFALKIFFIDLDIAQISDEHEQILINDYQRFQKTLGDEKFLIAMGPFIKKSLIRDYGDEARIIAKGLYSRPAKYFAIDRRYVTAEEVIEALGALNIKAFMHKVLPKAIGTRQDFSINDLKNSIFDHVWIMDAGSQITAEFIQPKPSDKVLDLCAGEGNKAHYITMKDCHYVAADIDEKRLNRAGDRLRHKKNVEFVVTDGRSTPFVREDFDWILLDAPCSGLGVLRRNPDLVHRFSPEILSSFIKLQQELLSHAITLLKPGGRLIYATCSLLKAENEQQIEKIEKKENTIMSLSLKELKNTQLRLHHDDLNKNSLTLFPHIHDCDGFFIHALTKRTRV